MINRSESSPAISALTDQAEISLLRIADHDRIAQSLNDTVVRRLFAAGLDLHTALELIGDHPGAGRIYQAIAELDLAIRDIRNAIFGNPVLAPLSLLPGPANRAADVHKTTVKVVDTGR